MGEDGISPSTDNDQGTAAEFTGETDGIMLPERDLIEVAENAIADVVFSPQSLAEGGVRAINVVDASGAVNANLFEDVLVPRKRTYCGRGNGHGRLPLAGRWRWGLVDGNEGHHG